MSVRYKWRLLCFDTTVFLAIYCLFQYCVICLLNFFIPLVFFIWIYAFTLNISEPVMFLFHLFLGNCRLWSVHHFLPTHSCSAISTPFIYLSVFKSSLMAQHFSPSNTVALDSVGFLYEDLTLLTSFKALSTNLTVKVVSFLEAGNYCGGFLFCCFYNHFESKKRKASARVPFLYSE